MAASSGNQWSLEENMLFEEAMASNPELFIRGEWHLLTNLFTTKTGEEIKARYENQEKYAKMSEYFATQGPPYTEEELKEDIKRVLDGSIQPPSSLHPPTEEALEEALKERGYELKKTP